MNKHSRLIDTAIQNLKNTTLRTILAMLGILVGTASVVAMVSTGKMATEAALAQFKTLGTNLMSISLNNRKQSEAKFTVEKALSIQNASKDIDTLAPYVTSYAQIIFQGKPVDGMILGVTQNLADIIHLHLLAGRFISVFDKYEQFCVLGYDIFKNLNIPANQLIGSRLNLGDNRFVIIGIADKWPENAFFNQNVNTSILVPILTTQFLGQAQDINSIILRLRPNVTDLTHVKSQIQQFVGNIAPEKEIFFRSAEELIKSMEAQHTIFILLLGLIGGISLLVGGIGVMNIMLMAVLERRREIGIRLAIGAHKRDIQMMFLAESVLMSVVGGLLGIIIGILFSLVVAFIAGWAFKVFLLPPIVGFSSSVLIGVFFGFYPAYQASKLDPIQALRIE
jgi:putative ABC transport system permease protein